ncbi:MAG: phosphatase PAP2 family protein [Firmicutes bacterium]|nr:phosphatase PAP2 family protein [Bacillota bacterium]
MIKKWILKNRKWIFLSLFILLFLLLIETIFVKEIFVIDDYIYHHISKLISNNFTKFFKLVTHFGDAPILIGISIGSILFLKNKKIGMFMSLNLVINFIFNQYMKIFFERPRPIDLMIVEERGYSFPSGHSMISMAFYGFIIFLIWKYMKNKNLKWLYTILLGTLIIFIGTSRIYLGVHYASDVLAGFYFSIAYLIIYTTIISPKLNNAKSTKN